MSAAPGKNQIPSSTFSRCAHYDIPVSRRAVDIQRAVEMHQQIRLRVVRERPGRRREVSRIPARPGDAQLIELLARGIAGAARAWLSGAEADRAGRYRRCAAAVV